MVRTRIGIIGAGPAGLTAAYLLCKQGMDVVVYDSDPVYVGGISRTVTYKGYHFDIGGHRFFSKSKEVEDLWSELLPNDMILRPRSSRIFYNGKFYSYPLKAFEALTKLGFIESCLCVASYFKARLVPIPEPQNFEEWTSNHFGKRLFNIFFKTYTEKVWGMACTEISADWAAQRIKGLSLGKAILTALTPKRKRRSGDVIKSLIESFRYPRLGPGMLWEACAKRVEEMGGQILMGHHVGAINFDPVSRKWQLSNSGVSTEQARETFDHIISSAPMREVAKSLKPALPKHVIEAASKLKYRDFLTVVVILPDRNLYDDNWIYIHDPNVKVGRIQNFKSWSPEMVPDSNMCCLGLEYFCFEGDGLWTSSDADLITLAKKELEAVGLASASEVVDGCVVRQAKAYPVYDDDYAAHVEVIRKEAKERFPTLHFVGRNGMHKYNNQDHAMMTAMLCVENIVAGRELYDVWQVNEDAEYHEVGDHGVEQKLNTGLRLVPMRQS